MTLKVSIQNSKAVHLDCDNAIPEGDAFDFAEHYYKKHGDELLQILIEEMNLKIGKVISQQFQEKEAESVQYLRVVQYPVPKFSYFNRPVSNTSQQPMFLLLMSIN